MHVAFVPAAATVAIILLLLVTTLRRSPPVPRTLRQKVRKSIADQSLDEKDDRHDHWALAAEKSYDRRKRVRRAGTVTPIRVATAPEADPVESTEGLVLDRTSRGLCFASERRYDVGDAIFVLAVAARPDVPWVAATIRNCRECDDYFLIGCEFHSPPPVSVFLLFG